MNDFAVADVEQPSRPARSRATTPSSSHRSRRERRSSRRAQRVGGAREGNLIAMRPDKSLAPLLGLADANDTLENDNLTIDTPPGAWGRHHRHPAAVPRHSRPLRHWPARAAWPPWRPEAEPRDHARAVGAGHASAFTYDLARSVVWDAAGQSFPGSARTATRSSSAPTRTRSPAPTTSSSVGVTRSPTGSTSTGSRSRRRTSSSNLGQHDRPVQPPRPHRASGICLRGNKAVPGDDRRRPRPPAATDQVVQQLLDDGPAGCNAPNVNPTLLAEWEVPTCDVLHLSRQHPDRPGLCQELERLGLRDRHAPSVSVRRLVRGVHARLAEPDPHE